MKIIENVENLKISPHLNIIYVLYKINTVLNEVVIVLCVPPEAVILLILY
jgi:hypothetical protein